ncbi:hypothetical protein O6H91_23G028300 [Diphasiastrum complanatum]|uniref:Uncharacterized protein n=3 Tax=Diphasiastrum complanatum TaxID=34168 RepID=A0ACC2A7T4_DIPCM|nr:hypothetical protein O6H91_23G005200 [Diphasiastrum complanatum]KAJ7513576.1 hypothetical protein O6H91_23G005200 [Diphasiastrum complanatum]KAJ7514111.1 hypothetical protein O6H91_23G028300 [Diphasiastrum complanatum]
MAPALALASPSPAAAACFSSTRSGFPALAVRTTDSCSLLLLQAFRPLKCEAAQASWHKQQPNVVSTSPRASAQQASFETLVGGVTEVDKDNFWPTLEAVGNNLVVLDMYTQWCGPCKLMYPKLVALSEQYVDVIFLKIDCNQQNKPLAKELGVRVVPTFKIFKNKALVGEVAGAKYDELVKVIDKLRTGAL